MTVVIVGNGILGLMTAYRLVQRSASVRVTVVGPTDHKGCASLAAAAMFNSFCEVDVGTLSNKIERQKWLFNHSANRCWPGLLKELEVASGTKLEYGFGTYLVNNHATDPLEDENFDAVLAALTEFGEPHELVAPSAIPHYRPGARGRAARAVFIPREGWVNPVLLIAALKTILGATGRVQFVADRAERVEARGGKVSAVALAGGQRVAGEGFVLAPGATFSTLMQNSQLGLEMPRIFYGVGCTVLLKTGEMTLTNCVRTPNRGLACGIYAAPQDPAHTIVGASNFISPGPEDYPRITSVHTILGSVMEQVNADYYRSQLVRVNLGWRPTSEDTLPLLGGTALPNLFVATGTKRDGLHCSPVIAEYLSDLILGGRSEHDLALFAPERKPVRVYTRREAIDAAVRHTLNAAYQHGFVPARNRMVEEMERHYREDFERLHDSVGAHDWGIPVELLNMYKYGHAR
jgi:glycine/D-amino acid oxidase-like deaminating enzyme